MFSCPKCHGDGVVVNIGKTHFGTCKKCKIGWWAGHDVLTVEPHDEATNLKYLTENFKHYEVQAPL